MSKELIQTLNSSLWQLGWNWQHPRIKSYLGIVAQRLKTVGFQSLEEIPEDYLQRLIKLVNLYYQCDRLLKLMKRSWEDQDIRSIVSSYGYADRMPLKGYEALHKFLDDHWYDKYGF
jgi:hypothetical protein